MTKESILVTGGDGNIGSEVIKQLSSTGADLGVKWHVTRLLQY
jgi:nucleoside-diphosphate-sugar epimerase